MENVKLNLYQKLLEIQKEVKGLGKNKAGNGYEYVTGSKVLEHIKPLMNKHSLLLKQEVLKLKNERQNYIVGFGTPKQREKSEILSTVKMKFTWIDCESGEKDESIFWANGQNDWDKGVGSALTYGERYFLLKFFHIATDQDDIDNPERKIDEQKQIDEFINKVTSDIENSKTLSELSNIWKNIHADWKLTFLNLKNEMKEKLTNNN